MSTGARSALALASNKAGSHKPSPTLVGDLTEDRRRRSRDRARCQSARRAAAAVVIVGPLARPRVKDDHKPLPGAHLIQTLRRRFTPLEKVGVVSDPVWQGVRA